MREMTEKEFMAKVLGKLILAMVVVIVVMVSLLFTGCATKPDTRGLSERIRQQNRHNLMNQSW